MTVITYNTHGEEGIIVNIKNVFVDITNILWIHFDTAGPEFGVRIAFKNHVQEHLKIRCTSAEEVQTLEDDFRTLGFVPNPDRFTSMEKNVKQKS